ncbi:50S ribosomal protein L21 [Litoreibacter roseus]|nr:50S ribosomal protein L21 [Litoreibacter roseus]
MFAVLKTGGKQYKVAAGDILRVEKLDATAGEKVQFNEVLMLGGDNPVMGVPLVDDAGVQAEVIDQIKGEKVIHFVKRRRKHGSKRTKGHRQQLTLLRVTDILEKGAGKSGIKAAVGGAGLALASVTDGRYAKNRSEQAEMKKRVETGEAPEKSATKTAEPKKAAAKKAAPKKAAKADEGADDLKKLSGVGPALEKKLNEAGVTTFAQIAAWTEDDVAAMDEKLSFKGRIEREGWIDQAKDMAKG